MFSKALRLPLFGLLVLVALTLLAFVIFSSDEASEATHVAENDTEDSTNANDSTEDEPVYFTNFNVGIGENTEGEEASSTKPDIGNEPALIEGIDHEPITVKTEPVKEEPKKAPSTKGAVVEYKIKSGDVISKIARKFGCKSSDIYRLNERINKNNANKIQVGWKIQVIDNKGVGGKVVSAVASKEEAKTSTGSASPTTKPTKTDAPKVLVKRDTPVLPVAPELEDAQTHVYRVGDSYFKLAMKYYGSIDHWKLIKNANPHWDILKSPFGIKLTIPALPSSKGAVASKGKSGGLIPSRR